MCEMNSTSIYLYSLVSIEFRIYPFSLQTLIQLQHFYTILKAKAFTNHMLEVFSLQQQNVFLSSLLESGFQKPASLGHPLLGT